MKVLGIIIARGGTKELPNKNLMKIGGLSLIERSILSAQKSKLLSRIILSTDSSKIIKIAKKTKVEIPFVRPNKYSRDTSSVYSVMKHAINWLDKKEKYMPDIVVLLQCSAPFRTADHIDNVIKKLIKTKADSVLTITKPDYPPYWSFNKDKRDKITKLIKAKDYFRRQDIPKTFQPAGSVYAYKTKFLLKLNGMLPKGDTRGVEISREEAVNIDTLLQYDLAKFLWKKNEKKKIK